MKRGGGGHTKQGYLKAQSLQELVKSYVVSICLKTGNDHKI